MCVCGPYLPIHVEQFIISDTAKEQRVIDRRIGDEMCDQEELRGFTKRQVHEKRNTLSKARRVKV